MFFAAAALGDSGNPVRPRNASFSTLVTTPLGIEGLTNDNAGNLYAPGRAAAGQPCPVYRVDMDNPQNTFTVVGNIPAPSATTACSPSGLAFGPDGQLYVTQSNSTIYRFTPDAGNPPTATVFATDVPGNNGLAFDWNGNVWTGDGTTVLGRVWRISPDGVPTEFFRIQPMANVVTGAPSGVDKVGRSAVTLPANTAQPLVANGLAFDHSHNLIIADSARGALWRIHIRRDSTPDADTGCDETFTADTLCLTQVWVQHPYLDGSDGIVVDEAGNVWSDANERNAVIFVSNSGVTTEVFRNPVDAVTKLRNAGPLETPTSPVLVGHTFCTANSDGNRRDNSPAPTARSAVRASPRARFPASTSGSRLPECDCRCAESARARFEPPAKRGLFLWTMPYHSSMKIIGIAGFSGSGKTTLIEKLIPLLIAEGLRVSLIKHAHHEFDVDQPGKDSWRHRHAGCSEVMVSSSKRWALMHELRGAAEPGLLEQVKHLAPCDLLIVEGYKGEPIPKIEVHRRGSQAPLLHPDDPNVVAVATDEVLDTRLPQLALDDASGTAAFIMQHLGLNRARLVR